jgi:hypothetical protein
LTAPQIPTAQQAWAAIRDCNRHNRTADSLHPAAAQAAKAFGGLDVLGYADESELKFIEARFLKEYDALAAKAQEQEALPAQVREFIGGAEVKRIGGV